MQNMTMTDFKAQLHAKQPELLEQAHNLRQWLEQLTRQMLITPKGLNTRSDPIPQGFAADQDEQNCKNDDLLEEIKRSYSCRGVRPCRGCYQCMKKAIPLPPPAARRPING